MKEKKTGRPTFIRHVAFAALMALVFLLFYGLHRIVVLQECDGLRINLAGRQRMLIQKATKELLLHDALDLERGVAERTMRLFSSTLDALIDGGSAPLDLEGIEYRRLPAMESDATRQQLLLVRSEWGRFRHHAEKFLALRNQEDLAVVIEVNGELLGQMDRAVMMMQRTSEKNDGIMWFVVTVGLLGVAVSITWAFVYQVRLARQAARRVATLERALPICANCKAIRREGGESLREETWIPLEAYLAQHTNQLTSHGICPECMKELYPEIAPADDE